jgi:hypothetical protein
MSETTQDLTTVVTEPLPTQRFQRSYESKLPDILKIPRDEYFQVNVDIPAIVTMTLGASSGIEKLREPCKAALPGFDHTLFDSIEPLALAMGYAHSRHLAASRPVLPVQQLSERVIEMRETLIMDWGPYARRGWMDGERLKNLKGPLGYKNQAFDLLTLVAMGREAWPRIQGKTAITAADLAEAELLADQLLTAVGERDQLPAASAPSADIRRGAYTLFSRAYDQLRRAAEYLRWDEGDAETFVPLLSGGRKRRGSEVTEVNQAAAEPTPLAQTAHTTAKPEPMKNGSNVAAGMPGNDPFVNA